MVTIEFVISSADVAELLNVVTYSNSREIGECLAETSGELVLREIVAGVIGGNGGKCSGS